MVPHASPAASIFINKKLISKEQNSWKKENIILHMGQTKPRKFVGKFNILQGSLQWTILNPCNCIAIGNWVLKTVYQAQSSASKTQGTNLFLKNQKQQFRLVKPEAFVKPTLCHINAESYIVLKEQNQNNISTFLRRIKWNKRKSKKRTCWFKYFFRMCTDYALYSEKYNPLNKKKMSKFYFM